MPAVSPPRAWVLNPKYLLFSFIALMLAYVLYHNEHFLVDATDSDWPHYRHIGRWLLPHGLAGATALLLGLSQFSTSLRTPYTRLHRVFGRVYVCAVCIVAPIGAYMEYLDEHLLGYTRSFTMATVAFATLWVYATLMAFWCIRTRRIELHRQWMTRSLAMALVFLEVRVVGGLTGWENLGPNITEAIVWSGVALGYPLADTVLHIQEILRTRSRRSPVAPSPA